MSPSAPWIYRALRPLLFRLDAERAHRFGLGALRWMSRLPLSPPRSDPRLAQRIHGLDFPSPVGLAAGMDKNAEAPKSFVCMGLGFIEVGTVTPLPQPGNPKPRLLRHPGAASLQNWLGFNNDGLEGVRPRLEKLHPLAVPLGVNIGKNKSTLDEAAEADYLMLVEGLETCCDFFVVNVSSPNTPGLRDLQEEGRLRSLLSSLSQATRRPLWVKLAPDLAVGQAARLALAAIESGAAGLVLTNTTIDYSLLPGVPRQGGLSGRVLAQRSFEVLREVAAAVPPETVLVSVGGVDSGLEAYRRFRAGARLVELYTGLVYGGPGLPRRINRDLARRLEDDGAETLEEVIGVDRPAFATSAH